MKDVEDDVLLVEVEASLDDSPELVGFDGPEVLAPLEVEVNAGIAAPVEVLSFVLS